MAELVRARGSVERDHAGKEGAWTEASEGDAFHIGDGVRTGPSSQAALDLADEARLQMEPETTIRFVDGPPDSGGTALDVATGAAEVESGGLGTTLHTDIGTAQIDPNTTLRVGAHDEGLAYEVAIGSARLETADGTIELEPDEGLVVDIGGAVIERAVADAGAAEAAVDGGPLDAGDAGSADAGPAEVTAEVRGRPIRLREPDARRWRVARPGTVELAEATRVRVPARGEVELRRGDEAASFKGAGELTVGRRGEPLLGVQGGRVSLRADGADVTIEVPGGRILADGSVEGGSEGEARVRAGATRLRVERGRMDVETEDGEDTLEAGESMTLDRGGDMDVMGRGPERAHFVVQAGGSFMVRDARAPTAVGFRFGKHCSEGGIVERLRGGRVRAASRSEGGSANLLFPPGRHDYRLRCLAGEEVTDEVAAKGNVHVTRDSGRAPLPRTPPRTLVDTDGRRYTVLYQNLLPEIVVRWGGAPSASSYVLHVASGGRARTVRTDRPRHSFDSGELPEGQHRMWFETGSERSDKTTLVVGFDNAASTVSLQKPRNGKFEPGETVAVSGQALEGWKISVGGTELPLDAHHRFAGKVAVPSTQDGLAIRLSHPARGVQYYVRRAEGAR